MKHDYYTLIAYKRDRSNSASKFLEYSIDRKDLLIEQLAEVYAEEKSSGRCYSEIFIYKNGFNLECPNFNGEDFTEEDYESLTNENEEITSAAKIIADKLIEQNAEKERREYIDKRLKESEVEKEKRHRQYLAFKQEFEPNNL